MTEFTSKWQKFSPEGPAIEVDKAPSPTLSTSILGASSQKNSPAEVAEEALTLWENEGNPKAAYPEVNLADIPILPAYDDGCCYQVWCEHCRIWHRHSRENGHRVAHCYWPLSPHQKTGYFTQRAGDWKNRPRYREQRRSPQEIEKAKNSATITTPSMPSVSSVKGPAKPNAVSDNLLARLQAGSRWLTAQHLAWLEDKQDAVGDDRFSVALAAWDEMERSLRMVFGYEGCVFGPDRRCPDDAPATCDYCMNR
jgi:hypothetical protein